MSGCGFRGRGFGSRGARSNSQANGFGPRYPHPNFNHPRPPLNRVPGPDNWIERPNYLPWQSNSNFHQRPQFRGNLQFRPNGRGRTPNGRGIIRFSGPGRPPAPQFVMGFVRNARPRVPLLQEDHGPDKSVLLPQIPLLGSEEERQQKITETADKLKEKLSSITEEELTTFWEDDLSALPNSTSEEEIMRSKGIPELRHEPPELDLTFTDFKDIGRVDSSSSNFDNADNTDDTSDIMLIFTGKTTDKLQSTNDEITIISDDKEESLECLKSVHNNKISNASVISLENDVCQTQHFHEVSNSDCNVKNLYLQSDDIREHLGSTHSDASSQSFSLKNVDTSTADVLHASPIADVIEEGSKSLKDAKDADVPTNVLQDQVLSHENILHNQDTSQANLKSIDNTVNMDMHQANDISNTTTLDKVCHNTSNLSGTSQIRLPNFQYSNEANEGKNLSTPLDFQARAFNGPPRFNPRVSGPRCRWTYQQNGKNLFLRGSQRSPIHCNRIPPPRHVVRFPQPDLVPIPFDPRTPPRYTHNIPIQNHDPQHHPLMPYSPNDLPLTFDPSEPPPNVRSTGLLEVSTGQEMMQPLYSFNPRNQSTNISSNNIEILQPPPAFDPRGPPPRISSVPTTTSESLPNFNPQQPPPKFHCQEDNLQLSTMFDSPHSSQEHCGLMASLDASGSNAMTMNLVETAHVTDYSMVPVTAKYPQMPPITIPLSQGFMPNLPMNFQTGLQHNSSGNAISHELPLHPPPHINVSDIPPPPPKKCSKEKLSNSQQGMNIDDGLEDMHEAMEFAKQVMNMTGEIEKSEPVIPPMYQELSIPPSEIPVPKESPNIACPEPVVEANLKQVEKSKTPGNMSRSSNQSTVCESEVSKEKEKMTEQTIEEEHNTQKQSKVNEERPLTNEHIRPKVIFNLNSKLRKINKQEEWHYECQGMRQRRKIDLKKNCLNNSTKQPKEHVSEKTCTHPVEMIKNSAPPKSKKQREDKSDHKDSNEKSRVQSTNTSISSDTNVLKLQKSKKQCKKHGDSNSESSWKNKVINRFLKMSKNDICNMVNNSSLRKFDIAMKHLVKERRSTLSLEMRNTEDEKMKEYDREEFMNQLNAMLDPSAVVGITDLPTEFIHHLSEVLQLDPMPFNSEISVRPDTDILEQENVDQNDTSALLSYECFPDEQVSVDMITEHADHGKKNKESEPHLKSQGYRDKTLTTRLDSYDNEEHKNSDCPQNVTVHCPSRTSEEMNNLSNKYLPEEIHPEVENSHKKQQPLFNEADLDNILSEVTEKTRNISKATTSQESKRSVSDIRRCCISTKARTGISSCKSVSPQIRNRAVADLDDIFTAGIAKAKLSSRSVISEHSRSRKSTSEDRSTFRTEKYLRWSRKERENPDAFRNLTKEEWEAKHGRSMNTMASPSSTSRRSGSNGSDNLYRERERRNYRSLRYCSSDSPMRHLSISPLVRDTSTNEKNFSQHNGFEEIRKVDQMASSSSTSNESSTSSSSDSSEEIVSPNVTKLLKVIKEKEKIAKKKSLNETIRDEVAAEIEKKWKEKNKYKERKSRKRERRKKDRHEKRRKERKKKRRRSSQSDISKSNEQIEEHRLLTEDEIKKEVTIKQEPDPIEEKTLCANEDTALSSSLGSKTTISVSVIPEEPQNSQVQKSVVPAALPNAMEAQVKNNPMAAAVTMQQTKTKAQLKQMPESSYEDQRNIKDISVEDAVDNPNLLNMTNDGIKTNGETTEITCKSKDDQKDKLESTNNNSLNQIDIPLNIPELPAGEVRDDIRKSSNTLSTSLNVLNLSMNLSAGSEHSDQKLDVAPSPLLSETKSCFKKIDIKAYKERALQRRLKEQSKLNNVSNNSVQLTPDLQPSSTLTKIQTELQCVENERKVTEMDVDRAQMKDPRIADEVNLTIAPCVEAPSKEVKERSNLRIACKSIETLLETKDALLFTQSKNSNESLVSKNTEKGATEVFNSSLNAMKSLDKCKDLKTNNKLSAEARITSQKELDESQVQVKSKLTLDEKNFKKSIPVADLNKFKNIRSEGSKELKLKKEKCKKLAEKKKKLTKQIEPLNLNIADRQLEKYAKAPEHRTSTKEEQQKAITNTDSSVPPELKNITDCPDYSEALGSEKFASSEVSLTLESMTSIEDDLKRILEHGFDGEASKEQTNTQLTINHQDLNNKSWNDDEATDNRIHSISPHEILEDRSMKDQGKGDSIEDHVLLSGNTPETTSESTKLSHISSDFAPSKEVDKSTDIEVNSFAISASTDNIQLSTKELSVPDNLENERNINVEEAVLSNICADFKAEDNSGTTNNIEMPQEISVKNGSTLCIEMNTNIVNNNDSTNANTDKNRLDNNNKDKIEALSLKDKQKSNECNKILDCRDLQIHDVRSPGSSGSPFKGFQAESIEEDIRDASELLSLGIKAGNIKGKLVEDPKRWLETCFGEKFNWRKIKDNEKKVCTIENKSSNETEMGRMKSSCKSVRNEQRSICSNTDVDSDTSLTCNKGMHKIEASKKIEVPSVREKSPGKENKTMIEEAETSKNSIEQRSSSPIINTDSQDVFDEDSEPFIVLDEYIDDTDGKSIEKIGSMELDFEDCIARDADGFLNKDCQERETDSMYDMKSPDFSSGHFKVLSEVSDKDDEVVAEQEEVPVRRDDKESGSIQLDCVEKNTLLKNTISGTDKIIQDDHLGEQMEKLDEQLVSVEKHSPLTCEIRPDSEKSSESRKEHAVPIDIVSKNNSQGTDISKLLHAELSKTQESNVDCNNEKEKSLKSNSNVFKTGNSAILLSQKLNIPTKAALKKVTENVTMQDKSLEVNSRKQTDNQGERKNNELTHAYNEDVNLNNNVLSDLNVCSSIVKIPTSSNIKSNSANELEKSKELNNMIEKKQDGTEKLDNTSSRKEDSDNLHKIKNKPKMKHKQEKKRDISLKKVKEAVKSDIVQSGYPNTKETIMARMIEIDVEIHKLMTEKMTLYQMLKSEALPENNLQPNDTAIETEETDVAVPRPRTPSALVSQLIQNMEVQPVVSQTIKGIENSSLKDSAVQSSQSNKHKALFKHESSAKRSTLSCKSDDEQVIHSTESTRSTVFKKKKKQKLEKGVKWEDASRVSSAIQEVSTDKKQANDAPRSVLKKINSDTRQEVPESNSVHVLCEPKPQASITEVSTPIDKKHSSNSNKSKVGKRTTEIMESPAHHGNDKSKVINANKKQISTSDGANKNKLASEEETMSLVAKLSETKTSEGLSIYSDDSTWESCLPNPGLDTSDEKKPNTGLALLEETYRKEIAKSRKTKADARRKKKRQLHNLLKGAHTLTAEEEELPLSTLYIKKLQQKKSLLDSLDSKTEEASTSNDPQLWRNVVEIINAVAENRIEDLYGDKSEKQSDDNSMLSGTPNKSTLLLNENPLNKERRINTDPTLSEKEEWEKSKIADEVIPSITSKDKPSREARDTIKDIKKENIQFVVPSSKLLIKNSTSDLHKSDKLCEQDTGNINTKNVQDITKDSIQDFNIECKIADSCHEKTVKNHEGKIDLPNLVETSSDNQYVSIVQTAKGSKLLAGRTLEETKEKSVVHDLFDDAEQVLSVSEHLEKMCSNSIVCKNYAKCGMECVGNKLIVDAVPEKSKLEVKELSEEELKAFSVTNLNEKTLSEVESHSQKINNIPKSEYLMSMKGMKGPQKKRKESERSNETSSEDNFNDCSSNLEYTNTSKNDDPLNKKMIKRKRGSGKTPIRRSSRYTEETSKRIRLESDISTQNSEQYTQDRTVQTHCLTSKSPTPLSSHDEEAENTSTNIRKIHSAQKSPSSRKRSTHSESELSGILLASNDKLVALKEDTPEVRKCKEHTILQMMSCKVRLIDSKYTILKPNVNPNILRKFGISRVNLNVYPKTTQVDSMISTSQEILTEDLSDFSTIQTLELYSAQNQVSKSLETCGDVIQLIDDQSSSIKSKPCPKPDIEILPVLTKEDVVVDAQIFPEPDIEIVEEKKSLTKNQDPDESESTLPVIEITDEKEIPRTQYTVHKGPVLDIKVFENTFLAASEDGRIYRYSQASNGILNIYKGHKSAVTCLYVYNTASADLYKEWMFSGSLDGTLRCYNITTGLQIRDTADIGSPIQCMDQAWGIIFIGTKSGHVSRYHIKSGVIKGSSIQFSDKSVLALKATNEGARRVLIVASRSQPITIRDAQSGLFLRTICGQRSHTVYSLMRDNNLIYCGTSSTSILVFDFTNGEQTMQYDAGVGIVCMRLYKHLLFAGCYDGNIYVFDTEDHRLVCSIPGPGNMLLSMEIIDNKIIAGSKDKRLQSWQMPRQVRASLQKIIQKVTLDTS